MVNAAGMATIFLYLPDTVCFFNTLLLFLLLTRLWDWLRLVILLKVIMIDSTTNTLVMCSGNCGKIVYLLQEFGYIILLLLPKFSINIMEKF